ncbi:MAG TPA: helix-turn-helix domain-containing protein [Anaerolineales bacterium]|nr:helix-turn-helix domain-containing protein [Anaerolineales bacterium]
MAALNGDEWLNLGEAAEILGVHPSTLRAWADHGEIPAHRTPGKHRRFRRTDVEAWAVARRESPPTAGQMIIQNALGRARMQVAEGQLRNTAWYQRLDEANKMRFREASRNLLASLVRYLGDEVEAALIEGRQIGQEYERLGREAGLTLGEKVNVFLYFRDFLYDSVIDVYQASGRHAAREWAQMHRKVTAFTNMVLLALVEAHEQKG